MRAEGRPHVSLLLMLLRSHLPYLLMFCLGTVFLATLTLLHHDALGTGYDLGIYDQVVWNLAHGRSFLTTLVYETGGYYDHFEPILALIAPIYWIFPDPRVLLVLQSLSLALGSLPIYLYTRQRFGAIRPAYANMALLPAVAYLAFPALHNANLNDFHEVSLIPPLLGFALYGLLTGRRRLMLVFLVLCLLVKEDFGVTALAFSVYILLLKPQGFQRRDGLILSAVVIVWIVLMLRVFYPAVSGGLAYPFVARRYPWLGDSPDSALHVLLTQPWIVVSHLLEPPKLAFVLRLFGPLLFLPLLGWPVIGLAFPILTYLMLSNYTPQWSVQSYYNPPLMPFLFFGLTETIGFFLTGFPLFERLSERGKRSARLNAETSPLRQRIVLVALTVALTLSVAYGYYLDALAPGGQHFNLADFQASARSQAANAILAQIPPQASVSTTFWLVPHLSERQAIYTLLARPRDPPNYLLTEQAETSEGAPIYPYAAPNGPLVYHEYVPATTVTPFQLWTYQRSVSLVPLQEPQPEPKPLSLAGYAWLDSPVAANPPLVAPGGEARLMLGWHRTGTLDKRYVFFVHLLDESKNPVPNGTGRMITQSGHEAGDGRFPTLFWESWTNPPVVLDEQRLRLPPDTPAGTYHVWAGVYDKATGNRIDLVGPGQSVALVGTLTVQQ